MPNKIEILDTNYLVKKDRYLVHRAKYSLGVNAMKYLSALICMIRADDEEFRIYEITAKELSELTGSKIDTPQLKKIVAELSKLQLPSLDENGRENGIMNWFDSITYTNDTPIVIRSIFGKSAKPYLLEFRNGYLKYGIENILPLNSTVIVHLYEVLKDKLECNKIQRKAVVVKFMLIDFRELFNIPNSYRYAHIKERYLDKAILQFRKHTDISMSYVENKKGKTIDSLTITVTRTKEPKVRHKNLNFKPHLKFKEQLLKKLKDEALYEYDDTFEYPYYDGISGYTIYMSNNGKPLLADENFRTFSVEEAEIEWASIYEFRNK